ncbi:MAG: AMP-binding protein [Candidatus Omnitrophica bacterium]|nr:AMP-binding protein [Candidatus Omnitrophota bacterium]MCB9722307.1 AMP-binding protein [Candidatus Omnitrophota bacterium]
MNPWQRLAGLSRDDIKQLQDRKLHQFINEYIYPFSPYYRKLFDDNKIDPRSIRRAEDLRHIPFTSKRDFIDDDEDHPRFRDFILQPDAEKIRRAWPMSKTMPLAVLKALRGTEAVTHRISQEFRPVFMTYTTGTTNKPIPFMYSNYDVDNWRVSGARMMNLFEVEPDEKVLNLFPYAPHLAFWQVVFGGLAACNLVLSTGGGKTVGTEGNIKALAKMQPTVVLGVPSYVYHVLRTAMDDGVRLDFVKKVVLGASKVTVGFKKKLAELLTAMGATDVRIFGTYGFTEARCAWAESPTGLEESSGYHLYPDREIFEVIDPETGEVKGEGEDGEIVYTSLDSRGSSVLRYRTGDFVRGGIRYDKCPYKNWFVPRLSSDIGRLSDVKDLQLSKVKGALVNLNHFGAVLSDLPVVDEWQLEIRKKDDDPYEVDELVVYVCVKSDCDRPALERKIRQEMVAATEVAPNKIVYIEHPEMVERLQIEVANKEKRVVDARPQG